MGRPAEAKGQIVIVLVRRGTRSRSVVLVVLVKPSHLLERLARLLTLSSSSNAGRVEARHLVDPARVRLPNLRPTVAADGRLSQRALASRFTIAVFIIRHGVDADASCAARLAASDFREADGRQGGDSARVALGRV
jgi:hypothetical protein